MKLELLDTNRLVHVNNLKECTSPLLFANGRSLYDQKGILSNEIFGLNRQDRKSTYAYISLGQPYIHPHVYLNILKRMCSEAVFIVSGKKKYKIVDGYFKEDPNGWTGISELYNHWDKIDWSKSRSSNQQALTLLKNTNRDTIFIDKFIIIPPGFREVTPATTPGGSDYVPEINKLYTQLIRRVTGVNQGGMFSSYMDTLRSEIQELMCKIYLKAKSVLHQKGGLVKHYLLGKTVTYGSRAVISAPSYNNNTVEENMISIDTAALPISHCCATFKPFISAWVKNFFTREIINNPNLVVFHEATTGRLVTGNMVDPEVQFSDKVIDKMINNYVRNVDGRFSLITVNVTVPGSNRKTPVTVNMYLRGKKILPGNQATDLNRPITVTDILYLASVDVCEKRHIMVSRYPVGTDKGIFFAKVRVQSTAKHIKVQFNGVEYPYYPDIDLKTPHELVGVKFIDSLVYSNSLLAGMGGDYDGDTVSVRGIWSDEANAEAENIMNKKISALNVMGSDTRTVSKEILNSYYELTKIVSNPVAKAVTALDTERYLAMEPKEFTQDFIITMLADTVDSVQARATKIRKAKHQTWDTMTIPANYFYPDQPQIKTTVGRFLFNKFVLQGAEIIGATKFIDSLLNKTGLGEVDELIGDLYLNDKINRKQFNAYIDRRDNLGYWLNGMLAHTISLKMAQPLREIEKKKQELFKKYEKELAARDIDTMKKIEDELVKYAFEVLKDDPGMDLYTSGDLNFENNYKNNSIIKGPVLNKIDNMYDFIRTSFMEGFVVDDIPALANSVVAGSYPGAVMTRKAGYSSKKLQALLQMAQVDEHGSDCGTKATIPITVTNYNKRELIDSYFVEGGKLKLLDKDNIGKYIGKTLHFRSPMGCLNHKFCNICAGERFYKLGIEQVGLYAVQLSHSLLNSALKTKHDATVKLTKLNPDEIIINI